ncbi:Uncharacterised protein [Klebsiella pneumoniae]|nr:Uncharacterised protein [Klebsiella pneumoniae]
MLPAQQRLVTGDATIFDVADSLIVERKLPGVNTAPDIGGHHIALPRLVIHFTFIPANLMVEAAFCPIHSQIGIAQYRINIRAVLRVD